MHSVVDRSADDEVGLGAVRREGRPRSGRRHRLHGGTHVHRGDLRAEHQGPALGTLPDHVVRRSHVRLLRRPPPLLQGLRLRLRRLAVPLRRRVLPRPGVALLPPHGGEARGGGEGAMLAPRDGGRGEGAEGDEGVRGGGRGGSGPVGGPRKDREGQEGPVRRPGGLFRQVHERDARGGELRHGHLRPELRRFPHRRPAHRRYGRRPPSHHFLRRLRCRFGREEAAPPPLHRGLPRLQHLGRALLLPRKERRFRRVRLRVDHVLECGGLLRRLQPRPGPRTPDRPGRVLPLQHPGAGRGGDRHNLDPHHLYQLEAVPDRGRQFRGLHQLLDIRLFRPPRHRGPLPDPPGDRREESRSDPDRPQEGHRETRRLRPSIYRKVPGSCRTFMNVVKFMSNGEVCNFGS